MLGDMLHQEEEFLDGFTSEKFMVAVEFNEKKKRKKEYPSKDTFFLQRTFLLPLCKQLRHLIKRSKRIIIVSFILFRIIYKIKASNINLFKNYEIVRIQEMKRYLKNSFFFMHGILT